MSLLAILLLQPDTGPRLSVNQRIFNEVFKDFKLASHTHHDLVLGESNPYIRADIFDFFFDFVLVCVHCVCYFDVLGYRDAFFVVVVSLPSMIYLLFVFVVLVDWTDPLELG